MREFKPGDVAMVGGVISLRVAYDPAGCPEHHAFDGGDHWHRADGKWICDSSVNHEHGRPLLVIDPEDRTAVAALCDALTPKRGMSVTERLDILDRIRSSTDAMQAALRSLLPPPKPDEPQGLGAVVRDTEGDLWVRTDPAPLGGWELARPGRPGSRPCVRYDAVSAVEVLSEGVTP